MGKNKLKKFADMEQLPNVFQLSYNDIVKEGAQFDIDDIYKVNSKVDVDVDMDPVRI